jgi:rod shape-determining protein MreD
MKAGVYFTLFFLIIPLQASLLNSLSIAGIKPDLALALLFIIGLLTKPVEATLVGMATGVLLDIGSASHIGIMGFTRGIVGLSASLLGSKVLNITNPLNAIVLMVFGLLEGICVLLFLELLYGSVPFGSLLARHIIPQSIYTGLLGVVLFRLIAIKDVIGFLKKRSIQKEF